MKWLEWHGGKNPVPGKKAAVIYRDGHIQGDTPSERLDWQHKNSAKDIIRYLPS